MLLTQGNMILFFKLYFFLIGVIQLSPALLTVLALLSILAVVLVCCVIGSFVDCIKVLHCVDYVIL